MVLITENEVGIKVLSYEPISSRIIKLTVKLQQEISFIKKSALVEDTDEETMSKFYNDLQNALDKIREKKIIIVGVWSARIGDDK